MLACGSPDACTGAVATELKRHLPQNQEEDKGPLEGARFSRLRAGVVSSGSSRLPGVYQALKSVVQPLLDLIVQSPEEGAEAIFSRPGLGYWSCRYLVCFWDGELFLIRLSLGHAAVSLSAENHRCPNHGAAGHLGARQALRVLLAGPLRHAFKAFPLPWWEFRSRTSALEDGRPSASLDTEVSCRQ